MTISEVPFQHNKSVFKCQENKLRKKLRFSHPENADNRHLKSLEMDLTKSLFNYIKTCKDQQTVKMRKEPWKKDRTHLEK
ncbi:MAG: hypothetical protein A2170_13055 [Deltaproteobacteria bacterium RBG_13_53_10]|nr:MAG: hypothetical protein A2170_13055 [Deltaproteobacteria bacterium RBG_13_53_10]